MTSRWVVAAALLGAAGVVLGALGAHGLTARVGADARASWSTAVHYQLFHAVALLALGLWADTTARTATLPATLWVVGIAVFSGSIYVLVLGGPRWLGPLTPLGGLCLIGGWLALLALPRS